MVAFVDGHVRSLYLSDLVSARYGSGPDLHTPFNFKNDYPEINYHNIDY